MYTHAFLLSIFTIISAYTPLNATEKPKSETTEQTEQDITTNTNPQNTVNKSQSVTARLSNLLTNTNSWWLRILLALLLGMLLSLTPCVYPMIPITVGILQSNGTSSVLRNFMLAIAYTFGIATTFATLGLASAFTGHLFGSLMSSPWVIGSIVLLLIYLAGAMIGWYEMYVPALLRNTHSNQKGGSLLAAFTFGAASGTVASPCLSPGLVLLLSIVTQMKSLVLGFVLLFAFGVGLSIPLLIIGTFSSSLNVLPRAGMWMVEIKKLFGFMMFYMCLYFIQPFAPWFIIAWLATALSISIAIYYLWNSQNIFHTILGIFFIAFSAWNTRIAYNATTKNDVLQVVWLKEYTEAKQRAIAEHKNILLDVSAPYCTICKKIEEKFFVEKNVQHAMNNYVSVKIDCADTSHKEHTQLRKEHNIIGAPTLVVINPENDKELKRWGGELYNQSIAEFVTELQNIT